MSECGEVGREREEGVEGREEVEEGGGGENQPLPRLPNSSLAALSSVAAPSREFRSKQQTLSIRLRFLIIISNSKWEIVRILD